MPERPSDEYSSRFGAWDTKAWVRSKPHHVAPFEPSLWFFSVDVSPLFLDPRVRDAPEDIRRALMVLTLYDWLEFTEWLEVGPVNAVCDRLRQAHFLPWLSPEMKADALRVYTDEAGHAEMSHALARAVEEYTGIRSARLRPTFLDSFDALVIDKEPTLAALVELFLAITSETLITGTLNKLPNDATVQQAVRDIAKDHANDEGRHHAYFRAVCIAVWPLLPAEVQRRIGVLLPEMILAFLAPSPPNISRLLARVEYFDGAEREIAEHVCGHEHVARTVRESCSPTLRTFREAGVFEHAVVVDAFRGYHFDVGKA
jgi:hypothetical protein